MSNPEKVYQALSLLLELFVVLFIQIILWKLELIILLILFNTIYNVYNFLCVNSK